MDYADTAVTAPAEDYLALAEVAARLNVSERTIRRLAVAGAIRAWKVASVWRVPPEAIDEYLAANTPPPKAAPKPTGGRNLTAAQQRVVDREARASRRRAAA